LDDEGNCVLDRLAVKRIETIPESCGLGAEELPAPKGQLVDVESEEGFEVYVSFRDRRLKVPLTYSAEDRHLTIWTMNKVLFP